MKECPEKKSNLENSEFINNAIQLAVTTALQLVDITTTKEFKESENLGTNSRTSKRLSTTTNTLPEISLNQVSWHDNYDDCWIILYDRIYDVTQFLLEHPGGADILLEYAGRDATLAYRGFGHSVQAWQSLQKYLIGILPEHERMDIFKFCETGTNTELRPLSSRQKDCLYFQ